MGLGSNPMGPIGKNPKLLIPSPTETCSGKLMTGGAPSLNPFFTRSHLAVAGVSARLGAQRRAGVPRKLVIRNFPGVRACVSFDHGNLADGGGRCRITG